MLSTPCFPSSGSLILLAMLCIGCGAEAPDTGPASTAPTAPTAADLSQGEALFREQACAICHGEQGDGVEDAGPALAELAPYWDVERLAAYLADPDGFREAHPEFDERRDVTYDLEMPAFDQLSDSERRLLAGWLLAR